MSRSAWFHCFSGIAGDMALGALVDAGADLSTIERDLVHLPVGGWALEAEPVLRCGIAATKVHVRLKPSTVVRTWAHIEGIIEEARLPERARDRALAAFGRLAEVEAQLHRRPVSQVHFHEVGALDSIIDVVGTCVALEVLGVDAVHSSPITVGRGMVRTEHGMLPNPSPAVVALLAEVGAPVLGSEVDRELTTPTGAALMASLAVSFGAMPPMEVQAQGFGAGTADPDGTPNVVQVVLGAPRVEMAEPGQPVTQLEVTVDDVTGEHLALAVAAALEAGAHDAWISPVLMKKGRPGHVVAALVDPARVEAVALALTSSTGSFGVRATQVQRWPVSREVHTVEVDGHPVRVKAGQARAKVEHDDAAKVAELTGRPVREVVSLAEESWRRSHRDEDPLPPPGGETA